MGFLKKNIFGVDQETGLQNDKTGFQIAETRFLNAETPKSHIFFARTWMDFAQKNPVSHPYWFFHEVAMTLFVILVFWSAFKESPPCYLLSFPNQFSKP